MVCLQVCLSCIRFDVKSYLPRCTYNRVHYILKLLFDFHSPPFLLVWLQSMGISFGST